MDMLYRESKCSTSISDSSCQSDCRAAVTFSRFISNSRKTSRIGSTGRSRVSRSAPPDLLSASNRHHKQRIFFNRHNFMRLPPKIASRVLNSSLEETTSPRTASPPRTMYQDFSHIFTALYDCVAHEVQAVIQKNPITAIATGDHVITWGFQSGRVAVTNVEGHVVASYLDHVEAVTALSITRNGTFLVSSAKDLQVFVYRCWCSASQEDTRMPQSFILHLSSPCVLASLCFCPTFSSLPRTRMIVCGSAQNEILLYHEQSFMWAVSLIHTSNTSITDLVWHPTLPLVVYTTLEEMKMLNVFTKQVLCEVPYGADAPDNDATSHCNEDATPCSPPRSPRPPGGCLVWATPYRLITGCRHTVRVAGLYAARVSRGLVNDCSQHDIMDFNVNGTDLTAQLLSTLDLRSPQVSLDLVQEWVFPHTLCGLAILDPSYGNWCCEGPLLCVLTMKEGAQDSRAHDAMHHSILLSTISCQGEEFISEVVPVEASKVTTSTVPCILSCTPSLPKFIFGNDFCVKVVSVSERDLSIWLVGNEQYEAAISTALALGDKALARRAATIALNTFARDKDVHQALNLLTTVPFSTRRLKSLCHHFLRLCEERGILAQLAASFNHVDMSSLPILSWMFKRVVYLLALYHPVLLRNEVLNDEHMTVHSPQLRNVVHYCLLRIDDWIASRTSATHEECHEDSVTHHTEEYNVAQHVSLDTATSAYNTRVRQECLALILDKDDQLEKCIRILLNTRKSRELLFHLLYKRYATSASLVQQAVLYWFDALCELSIHRFTAFLAEDYHRSQEEPHRTSIFPFLTVVQRLHKNRYGLFCYFNACFHQDGHRLGSLCHQYITLLAEFEPQRLLVFLQQLHQQKLLTHPSSALFDQLLHIRTTQVFLFYLLGRRKDALRVVLHELHDITLAIDFLLTFNDVELWNIFMQRVHEDSTPVFHLFQVLHASLEFSQTFYITPGWPSLGQPVETYPPFTPPLTCIKGLSAAVLESIPSLHQTLSAYFFQFHRQLQLHELCESSSLEDLDRLKQSWIATTQRGIPVTLCHQQSWKERIKPTSFKGHGWSVFLNEVFNGVSPDKNNAFHAPMQSSQSPTPVALRHSTVKGEASKRHVLNAATEHKPPSISSPLLLCVCKPSVCVLCFLPADNRRCIVVFWCGHVAHTSCFEYQNVPWCDLCGHIGSINPAWNFLPKPSLPFSYTTVEDHKDYLTVTM